MVSAGKNCSVQCPTRDHLTFGECLRAKNLRLSPNVNDDYAKRQSAWDGELNHYESAVRQGLRPEGTTREKVDKALKEAELNG